MAKLGAMPAQHIIDGFKGVIDFYYWRGIPCARKWPLWKPRTPTPPEKWNQDAFAYCNRLWGSLSLTVKTAFYKMAEGTTLTAKDWFVRVYMKGAIDFMPPEFFATEATQLLALAQLELIAELRQALQTVAGDRLLVRGMDQLFTFKEAYGIWSLGTISGAGGYFDSAIPPAGTAWIVTQMAMTDKTNAVTANRVLIRLTNRQTRIAYLDDGWGAGVWNHHPGLWYLGTGDKFRIYFEGSQGGDQIEIQLSGYLLTLET